MARFLPHPRGVRQIVSRRGKNATLRVFALSDAATTGFLKLGGRLIPVALGRSGVRAGKREGDGATPHGCWVVREVFYRPDQLRRPLTRLPCRPLSKRDGWCDSASDRNYNREVPIPYPASAEQLWRGDRVYDVIIVLGYNDQPRIKGRGSAIFMHLAREGFSPTEGCIAMRRSDLIRLLATLRPGDAIATGKSVPQRGRRGLR